MEIKVKRSKKFAPLYELPPDVSLVICIGGRGGGKTYEVSKFVAVSATIKQKRCCILRDEKELIRESILNEVLMRYDTANANNGLTPYYDRLDSGIKNKRTGEMVVLTKGFRASSTDKRANLKSISNIDIAVVEEAEDIRDEEKFNTFQDSLRNQGAVTIVILNTPDVNHWIIKRYFTTVPVEGEDGYFDIVPKSVKGLMVIKANYTDNEFLPNNITERYAGYGDPENPLYNKHYYLTAIMGYASSGRKGQVLRNVKPITLAEYMDLPYREVYGQDFGTAAPAGLVGVKMHRNRLYCRELNYKPLNTLELGKLYCTLGFGPADLIVADHADKKACQKLKKGWRPTELFPDDLYKYPALARGFNIVECIKGRDSVTSGLDELNQMEIYIVEESRNLWNEVANYVYAIDKNGNSTNDPVDDYNHCFVAGTMIITDKGAIPIEDIEEGMMVLTRQGFKEVLFRFDNGRQYVATYTFDYGSNNPIQLTGTSDHTVLAYRKRDPKKRWKKLKELKAGDYVYLAEGKWVRLLSNRSSRLLPRSKSSKQKVYNLMVKECPEYFANGVLVHNCIDPIRYVVSELRSPRAQAPSSV